VPRKQKELKKIPPSVLNFFQGQPLSVRLHVYGRWHLFSFPTLAHYLPQGEVFVDLGCGYGVWALYLAQLYPQARIVGSDPDDDKIQVVAEIARQNGLTHMEFSTGKAQKVPLPPCSLISLVDILYLVPYDEQIEILQKCAVALLHGGRIMVKEIGSRPRWKYLLNYLEEVLAVRVLGITRGREFYFRTEQDWKDILEGLGLRTDIIRLDAGYPHPHVLILGEKP
jgi:ubiquinone/menaquinone biosynthesis C-methylase UbiE